MTRPRKREKETQRRTTSPKPQRFPQHPTRAVFRTFSPQYHHKAQIKTAWACRERERERDTWTERSSLNANFIQFGVPKTATSFAENPPILAVGIFVNSIVKRGLVLIWRQLVPVLLLSQAERLRGLEWLAHGVYLRSCGSYSLMIRITPDSDLFFWYKQTYSDSIWW